MDSYELTKALLRANPKLSKYNPLPRILFFDDFNEGTNGWCELIGNHDGNLDNVPPGKNDFRPPQLSNCSFFDIGTHGALSGNYALKLATRPEPNHMAQAGKRLTFVQRGLVQFETYFTFKAEAKVGKDVASEWDGNFHPSELEFGDFTISNDVCEGADGRRYLCALRYVNTDAEGNLVRKWMYKTSVQITTKMVVSENWAPPIDHHVLHPDDWAEVPNGSQTLCYNELPTKINWHYLRWQFDTKNRRNVELQVNDHVMDLRDIPVPYYEREYTSIDRLLNFFVDVRTRTHSRNFLYLDSILVSVDW